MTQGDLREFMPTEDEIRARVHLDSNPDTPVARVAEMQGLCAFVRKLEARHAIETGSFTGSFAQAMVLAGAQVFSIDNYQHPPTRQRGPGIFIKTQELWDQVMFIHGDGCRKLPGVRALIPLGSRWVFFHDSDHSYPHVLKELRLAVELGAVGVACHDLEHSVDLGTKAAWDYFLEESGWQGVTAGNIGFATPREEL